PTDEHIRPLPAIQIIAELRRANRLVRHRIETIPAQNVIARAANQNVRQQIRQLPLPVVNQLEVLLLVAWINRQSRFVVLMEQLEVAIDIPRALVARRGRETTAAPARA